MNRHYTTWSEPKDVPEGLRRHIQFNQLLSTLGEIELATFEEMLQRAMRTALESALLQERLRWACGAALAWDRTLPKRAVFRAVALQFGVSEQTVKKAYYTTALIPQVHPQTPEKAS